MSSKKTVMISQSMLFPWVGFFEQIKNSDIYVRYDDVNFSKGSFTNRVQIFNEQGKSWLSLPIKNFKMGDKINDLEVNESIDWKQKHFNILSSFYRDSKYYDDLIELVDKTYSVNSNKISDISFHSILNTLEYFELANGIDFFDSLNLGIAGKSSQRVFEIVSSLNGSTYLTGHGAKNYLDHELFEKNNIAVEYINYSKTEYNQRKKLFDP